MKAGNDYGISCRPIVISPANPQGENSCDRSQRIRTYNFPENRVSDHRINFTLYKLDQVLAGNVQPLTDALMEHDRNELRGSVEQI